MISRNDACRICGGQNLDQFLDLTDQPLANGFLKNLDGASAEPKFPLRVYFCRDCNLSQLIDIVDKEVLFRDYIYFSSGMPKLSEHFKNYALDVMGRFLKEGDFVVEIASNDGVLLKFFKDSGYKTLGIDPAANVVKVAESLGIETVNDFFSDNLAEKILAERGPARAVLANNVVAHINDHHDLVRGVSRLIGDDGVFVFEAPYLMDMFENLAYDTIYHEHLSYLAVRPLTALFDKFGMEIFDVEIHPVQGQSLRVFAGRKGSRPVSGNVRKCVEMELDSTLDKLDSYKDLAKRIETSKSQLTSLLKRLKMQGKKIAAYGAPAKGNTLLNYCQIGPDIVSYTLDDLPSKQGLYTPGMHIPVVSRAEAEANPPDYYLLLAWNYLDPILAKEGVFHERGGRFIIPVGDRIKVV